MQKNDTHTARLKNRLLLFCVSLAALLLPASFSAASDVTLDELAEVMPEMRDAMDSVRLRKNPHYLNKSVVEARRLPKLLLKDVTLTGGEFKKCELPGLHLENITFQDYLFDDTTITNAVLKNVTFKNCTFIDSLLAESILVNCTFQGGTLERSKFGSRGGRGDFDNNTYENVIFDGALQKGHFYLGTASGSIILRNLRILEGTQSQGRYFAQGHGLQLEVDGCEVGKLDFLSVWRGGKLTVKNSSFRGARFWTGSGTEVSFEKCRFSGDTALHIEGTVPLTDCSGREPLKGHKTTLDIQGFNSGR